MTLVSHQTTNDVGKKLIAIANRFTQFQTQVISIFLSQIGD